MLVVVIFRTVLLMELLCMPSTYETTKFKKSTNQTQLYIIKYQRAIAFGGNKLDRLREDK